MPTCPDCGQFVAHTAESCPNCGSRSLAIEEEVAFMKGCLLLFGVVGYGFFLLIAVAALPFVVLKAGILEVSINIGVIVFLALATRLLWRELGKGK